MDLIVKVVNDGTGILVTPVFWNGIFERVENPEDARKYDSLACNCLSRSLYSLIPVESNHFNSEMKRYLYASSG